jgi:hypothetical protein
MVDREWLVAQQCKDHGRLPSPVPSLRLDGCDIPYSSSLKNLGLVIDNRFSWQTQASSVCGKVGFVMSRTSLATRMKLVQSLMVPLAYCCIVT